MLTYVSSVKLTALLSSKLVYKTLLGKNMPGTYKPKCSHHTVIPTLGTHQLSELVFLTKLVFLLYKIHPYQVIIACTQKQ